MKFASLIALLFAGSLAQAKIEVLFHPHDPTLEKAATWIEEAKSHVDIAMYNLDTSEKSPVVQMLKSPAVKARIESGALKIRLIYEGYDTPQGNQETMGKLEELGIDVRYLGKGVKMHHKFATIDSGLGDARVISGSANWSLSSYRNYNENILFLSESPEASYRYQVEFNRLWKIAKEYGVVGEERVVTAPFADEGEFTVHFNSPRLLKSTEEEGIFITDQLVRELDAAVSSADIATTRIRLEPLLEAVSRAAKRGVQVRLLLSQDDYRDLYKRAKWLFSQPGIQLRVKFYNLKASEYMAFQMHNKFMIVDRASLFTGSFNWSKSSETNHIENLIELRGSLAQTVLPAYEDEFAMLWDLGRAGLAEFERSLEESRLKGELPRCGFTPTSLEVVEIKRLLKANPRCK